MLGKQFECAAQVVGVFVMLDLFKVFMNLYFRKAIVRVDLSPTSGDLR